MSDYKAAAKNAMNEAGKAALKETFGRIKSLPDAELFGTVQAVWATFCKERGVDE